MEAHENKNVGKYAPNVLIEAYNSEILEKSFIERWGIQDNSVWQLLEGSFLFDSMRHQKFIQIVQDFIDYVMEDTSEDNQSDKNSEE